MDRENALRLLRILDDFAQEGLQAEETKFWNHGDDVKQDVQAEEDTDVEEEVNVFPVQAAFLQNVVVSVKKKDNETKLARNLPLVPRSRLLRPPGGLVHLVEGRGTNGASARLVMVPKGTLWLGRYLKFREGERLVVAVGDGYALSAGRKTNTEHRASLRLMDPINRAFKEAKAKELPESRLSLTKPLLSEANLKKLGSELFGLEMSKAMPLQTKSFKKKIAKHEENINALLRRMERRIAKAANREDHFLEMIGRISRLPHEKEQMLKFAQDVIRKKRGAGGPKNGCDLTGSLGNPDNPVWQDVTSIPGVVLYYQALDATQENDSLLFPIRPSDKALVDKLQLRDGRLQVRQGVRLTPEETAEMSRAGGWALST